MSAQKKSALFTTSFSAPLELFAQLDEVRARRARRTGKRPLLKDLLAEAVRAFVERETREADVH